MASVSTFRVPAVPGVPDVPDLTRRTRRFCPPGALPCPSNPGSRPFITKLGVPGWFQVRLFSYCPGAYVSFRRLYADVSKIDRWGHRSGDRADGRAGLCAESAQFGPWIWRALWRELDLGADRGGF